MSFSDLYFSPRGRIPRSTWWIGVIGLVLDALIRRAERMKYVKWAFTDQAEAECRFGEPVVQGDRAAVDWWGAITSRTSAPCSRAPPPVAVTRRR